MTRSPLALLLYTPRLSILGGLWQGAALPLGGGVIMQHVAHLVTRLHLQGEDSFRLPGVASRPDG
jgi:hypothetical protein